MTDTAIELEKLYFSTPAASLPLLPSPQILLPLPAAAAAVIPLRRIFLQLTGCGGASYVLSPATSRHRPPRLSRPSVPTPQRARNPPLPFTPAA